MFAKRFRPLIALALAVILLMGTQSMALAQTKTTTRVLLAVKKAVLTVGEVYDVPWSLETEGEADPVTLKSSKPSVVSVVSDRQILAVGAGKSKITVASGKKKAVLNVTVKAPDPESVTLDVQSLSLKPGESGQLTPKVLPEAANQAVTWKTSDKKVATVNGKGVIKAKKAGTCVITCTTKIGKLTAQTTVTVEGDPTPTTAPSPSPTPTPAPTGNKVSITERTSLCVRENYNFGKPASVDYLLKLETKNASGAIALKVYDPSSDKYVAFATDPVVKNAVYDLTIHYDIDHKSYSNVQNILSVVYNNGADKKEGATVKAYVLRPTSVAVELVSGGSGEEADFTDDKKTLIKYNATDKTSYTVPDGVEHISDNAFRGHGELKSITLPEGLKSTGEYCFRECKALTTINLPASLTTAEHCMFAFCDSLNNVVIPASLKTLPEWMFCDCVSLMNVTVPEGVTTIEDYAFYGCKALKKLTLPASVTEIKGEEVFAGCSGALIVYGKAGSAAESYCNSHGVTFKAQ